MAVSVSVDEFTGGEKLATWGTIIHTDAAADIAALKVGGKRVCIQTVGTYTSDGMEIHGSNDGTNYVVLAVSRATATDGDHLPADFASDLVMNLLETPRYIKPVPGGSAAAGFSVVVTAYVSEV